MPAFGYILLLNDNVHQYLTIKYDGWLLSYLPSVWRIWLLFYGSFFLAAGSLLFNFFCPAYVKQYGTAFEMVDRERDHRHHQHQTEATKRERELLCTSLSTVETSIFERLYLYPLQSNTPSTDALGTMLIHCWSIYDIKMPALRILIVLLWGTGLTLLAVPALFTFAQVTFLLVKSFFV
jgi:hypothetical protein